MPKKLRIADQKRRTTGAILENVKKWRDNENKSQNGKERLGTTENNSEAQANCSVESEIGR